MGVAVRSNLVDATADQLLERIVAGEFDDGALPSQDALATECGVSRLTVREAIKALAQRGLVSVEHGVGTFVVPTSKWHDLPAVAKLYAYDPNGIEIARLLIEVRRMIEIGAAEVCAVRRPLAVIAELRACLDRMEAAAKVDDVAEFVSADIEFHDCILAGTQNPFVAAIYDPLRPVLLHGRTQTSSVRRIRGNAIAQHRGVLEAIESGDPDAARLAMTSHMDQTQHDLDAYVEF